MDTLLDKYTWKDRAPKVHLLKGNPRKVIPKLAQDLNAGCVIMGTVSRTGIPGFVIGNTAESVMHSVDCSILAIKPHRFVSSVTMKKIKYY